MSSSSDQQKDRNEERVVQGQPEDGQDAKNRAAKERVQFEFSSDALFRLDQLKPRLSASTRTEVIRLSLRLLEWFSELPEEAMITVTDKEEILAKFSVKLLYGIRE
jgi:hypothetical protein